MELLILIGGCYALYTVGIAIATELDYRAVNRKKKRHIATSAETLMIYYLLRTKIKMTQTISPISITTGIPH